MSIKKPFFTPRPKILRNKCHCPYYYDFEDSEYQQFQQQFQQLQQLQQLQHLQQFQQFQLSTLSTMSTISTISISTFDIINNVNNINNLSNLICYGQSDKPFFRLGRTKSINEIILKKMQRKRISRSNINSKSTASLSTSVRRLTCIKT
ncbi:hypothetical protein RIR_jg11767.t1 [Rhizophagus irregularis DAOM 181602=DAOM 197198]|nr:hypothetical protein RIR_jg11767.t1 [Rhizophagus irregularis DAOM 181602=DAOM 197198]